jgi:ribonuclease HI
MAASETVKLYSDGSATSGKVGAAAVLIRPGKPHRILHYHLGVDSEHTVHEAELVGMLLATYLIKSEKDGQTSFALGVDNQAALAAFKSDMRGPAHSIAREILRMGHIVLKKRNRNRYSLTLRWTVGHEGIPGNELADKEAKRAAEGLTSNASTLPPFLRRKLAINASAVKQKFNARAKQRWKEEWQRSERGQNLLRTDSSTPSARFLHAISTTDISRDSASRITQLLTAHAPQNAFLKRINKVDSARCPSCGTSPETVSHFLLECPGYAFERWALEAHLKKKRKALTTENILGDPDLTLPLANYIKASHRFTNTLNNPTPNP